MNDFLVKTSGQDLSDDDSIKTLMLLHGWGMNSQVWKPIREALESQYHLLWVDLPGHGFNKQIEAENLEQIVSLVSNNTPDNTHLIGWSLGGMVVQALAQTIPNKIASMTLVTSTPRFSQSVTGDWQHAMSDEVLNRFAENLKQDTEKTIRSFIALQFLGMKDAKQAQDDLIKHILFDKKGYKRGGDVFEILRPCSTQDLNRTVFLNDALMTNIAPETVQTNIPAQQALDVGLSILKSVDLRNSISSCPEHWIFGEYDRLIPKEVINDLISLRPDAEITLLEKVGHVPFITHSDLFLKHLTDFINTLD